jgi:hypothetical protein
MVADVLLDVVLLASAAVALGPGGGHATLVGRPVKDESLGYVSVFIAAVLPALVFASWLDS